MLSWWLWCVTRFRPRVALAFSKSISHTQLNSALDRRASAEPMIYFGFFFLVPDFSPLAAQQRAGLDFHQRLGSTAIFGLALIDSWAGTEEEVLCQPLDSRFSSILLHSQWWAASSSARFLEYPAPVTSCIRPRSVAENVNWQLHSAAETIALLPLSQASGQLQLTKSGGYSIELSAIA